MTGIVLRIVIVALSLWLAAKIFPGLQFDGPGTLFAAALLLGIVNAIVKPIVSILSLPLYILTLGLFTLIVNALMLLLTEWITERTTWGLRIDDFGTAVLGALIISIVSFVLSSLTRSDD